MNNQQRVLLYVFVLCAIGATKGDNQKHLQISDKNQNCNELENIRRDVNAMNVKLLDEFKNDFSNILKRIMANNKNEVYQTLKVTQEEIDKILADHQKTIEQKRRDANETLNSMRGYMDNSYSLLADVSNSLVDNFAQNITNTKDNIDKIFEDI